VKIANEISMVEREAVMPRRWNGAAEREKCSSRWQAQVMHKTTVQDSRLARYDELQAKRATSTATMKNSLMRQKAIDEELAALHDNQIIPRTSDITDRIASLRLEQESEKETRKALSTRQKEIDAEIQALKDGDLSGI
jgi:cell division protein FtsB